jgi:hypothetical protein
MIGCPNRNGKLPELSSLKSCSFDPPTRIDVPVAPLSSILIIVLPHLS